MSSPEAKHEVCGRLQLDLMKEYGLLPHHRLLDIGCGWLRGGQHLIRYLDAGNYVGFEKDGDWLHKARDLVASDEGLLEKSPTIRATGTFELYENEAFEFAWAFSVFTHLDARWVEMCFEAIRNHVSCLLATFNRSPSMVVSSGHPRRTNEYTRVGYPFAVLKEIAARNGFEATDHGEFGHPSGQQLAVFKGEDAR